LCWIAENNGLEYRVFPAEGRYLLSVGENGQVYTANEYETEQVAKGIAEKWR
jgi:hypothetical protein